MPLAKRLGHPETPFPIGVEYYRGPTPKLDVWDDDFARIKNAGFKFVRSFSFWNHMEPRPRQYELDDFDRMFDLAEKHGLRVWLDLTLATHGSCPEWMLREFPDIRAVNDRGEAAAPSATAATPQGRQTHCYDHPAWREYGGGLQRHVINRCKDRPGLLIWGLWDGISPVQAPSSVMRFSVCYCDHTRRRYRGWLEERFTLEQLNERLLRRYRRWEDVEPARSNHNVVETLLYKQFQYENLVDHLKWMVGEVERIDPDHEIRAHAAASPRPWDEQCAAHVDSWGTSMSSNNLLTSDDPYKIADRAFAFDWSLVGGAAGCMFWQYRPEYLSFEGPGYNLVALDGEPTARFDAVVEAIGQIEGMREHLPLECPQAPVAIVYDPISQELFGLNDEAQRYLADLRGVYRTLWTNGIAADIVTPRMDWSGYRLVFLPNLALMTEEAGERILRALDGSLETRLVAEGSFGMYQADGQSSYRPPERFADRLGVRVADLSQVSDHDIREGRNKLDTPYGTVAITSQTGYAVLEPKGDTEAIASLDGETVAVRTADGRFTWYGLTLSAGFGDVGQSTLALGIAGDAGVHAPVEVEGDPLVAVVRGSRQGGRLLFTFNLERREATATLRPRWRAGHVRDLLAGSSVDSRDEGFSVTVGQWGVAVLHCAEA